MTITLYRQDFTSPQDGSGDSYFDEYANALGIEDSQDLSEITIKVDRVIESE